MKKIPLSCFTCIIITVLLLFSLNSDVFAATTGKIQGTIIDDVSKDPLPGVNVVVDGTVLGAATDENGYFFIINVPPGTYNLKASMVGYATETKENVRVYVDRTSTIDFGLKTQAVAGEEVTVTAARVPVPLDVSSTEAYVSGEDVAESSVARFDQMIALQAGVEMTSSVEEGEGFQIRGGDMSESVLTLDGISMQDELTKIPNLSVSRNLIQDVQILTGGFNAEYGNIRSGLINVITKDGSYNRYSGVLEGRISPAARKHYGVGPYDWNCQWYNTFLGTNWHVWDANATGKQYVGVDQLVGWGDEKYYDHGQYILAYDADLTAGTPNPGESYLDAHPYSLRFPGGWNEIGDLKPFTRETAIELFKWEFRGKKYAETPDQMVDIGVGGPIPGIPNTKFYTSHFWNKSFYVVPGPRENSTEMTNTFKVTNRIKSNMNLTVNFQYSRFHGAADFQYNSPANLGYVTGDNPSIQNFLGGDWRWDESVASPKIMDNYYGQIKFTHTYSPSTYYDITIGIRRNFNNQDFIRDRDLTKIKFIDDPELAAAGWKETILTYDPTGGDANYPGIYTSGDAGLPVGRIGMDERPRGKFQAYWSTTRGGGGSNSISQPYADASLEEIGGVQWEGGNQTSLAHISYTALTAQANMVSQIDRHNQIKAGFEVNKFHMNYFSYMGIGLRADVPSIIYPFLYTKYKADPYEFNAFIQDKLEWEGLIMNVGLRATVWAPGMDGFDLNPSNYFNSDAWGGYAVWKSEEGYIPGQANYEFRNQHTRSIKHKVLLQPRLGISHPITTSSKIFFNYGHFYQRPGYDDMYWICANKGGYGSRVPGGGMIPQPDMEWPKTVSYEIGYSQSIYDQVLLQVSGYYKDYTYEKSFDDDGNRVNLNIVSYYDDLNYLTYAANGYRDVRGIELRLERSFGRFINGWVNYNYMIQSRGQTGFDTIYEDPVKADDQWSSINQPRVDARPTFRTSITLRTPVGFGPGPALLGIKPLAEWRVNTIVTWRDGGEQIYDSSAPYKNWNYIQNIDRTSCDMYIRKTLARGASVYINIRNLFNIKYYRTTSQYAS